LASILYRRLLKKIFLWILLSIFLCENFSYTWHISKAVVTAMHKVHRQLQTVSLFSPPQTRARQRSVSDMTHLAVRVMKREPLLAGKVPLPSPPSLYSLFSSSSSSSSSSSHLCHSYMVQQPSIFLLQSVVFYRQFREVSQMLTS